MLRVCFQPIPISLSIVLLILMSNQAFADQGASVVSFDGYDDCIELSNESTTVTLCPAAGGRVLQYSLNGKNMMYLPARESDDSDRQNIGQTDKRVEMMAGRFDIGPEKMVSRGLVLWQGRWTGEITGPREAKLTSQFDPKSGVRLIRTFKLDASSSHLECTQTIRNQSDRPVSLCHWSRTFAIGGGVAVVPRTPLGRFPNGYVLYESGRRMDFVPEDPAVDVDEEAVVVNRAPKYPKLGFDSMAGWIAYLAPNNQIFVKRYATYPDRDYNEVAGLTASIWYPKDRGMVEIEPIGPAAKLKPGQQHDFTEHWYLLDQPFPGQDNSIDYEAVKSQVSKLKP